jgi:hypothetical protein
MTKLVIAGIYLQEQDCSASACVNKVLRSEHLNSETTPKTGKDRNTITAKNRKISDITEKLRRENQLHSQKSRYEVSIPVSKLW